MIAALETSGCRAANTRAVAQEAGMFRRVRLMERYRAESPLRKASRHLREIEEHIAELRELIDRTRPISHDLAPLEELLKIFDHSRELALQRLAIEKRIAASWHGLALIQFRRSSGRRSGDCGDT
jgi:hypothetical protein